MTIQLWIKVTFLSKMVQSYLNCGTVNSGSQDICIHYYQLHTLTDRSPSNYDNRKKLWGILVLLSLLTRSIASCLTSVMAPNNNYFGTTPHPKVTYTLVFHDILFGWKVEVGRCRALLTSHCSICILQDTLGIFILISIFRWQCTPFGENLLQ